MVIVIDNYDSFTWNLVDLVRRGPYPVEVYRNDEITTPEIAAKNPWGILLSPGPGRPAESGICRELVETLGPTTPIFGVCLGHQLLGEMFGMELKHAPAPVHGKTSKIEHDGKDIFEGLPNPLKVMRYHSLVLAENSTESDLKVTASTTDGVIMGIKHKFLSFTGVQFHPESILTESGEALLFNWLRSLSTSSNRRK